MSYSDLVQDDAGERIGFSGEHERVLFLCGHLGYRSLSAALVDFNAATPKERRDRDARAQGWTRCQQVTSFFLVRCHRLPWGYTPGVVDMRIGQPVAPTSPAVR